MTVDALERTAGCATHSTLCTRCVASEKVREVSQAEKRGGSGIGPRSRNRTETGQTKQKQSERGREWWQKVQNNRQQQ